MKKNTRFAFNAYLQQLARLNGVAVEELSSKFTVEPSVQQTLEDQIQQSAAFLTLINVTPVTEQSGQLLGLGVGSTIAGTTDTTAKEREPVDPTLMVDVEYKCEQTNFDTVLTYAKLDLWAKFQDFQVRIRDAIVKRQALDRIMIGFNGVKRAKTSNRSENPLLQDVNKGWLQKIREDAPDHVMGSTTTGGETTPGAVKVGKGGEYANLDAVVMDAVNELIDVVYQDDDDLVVICGRELLSDKYFPLVNKEQENSEKLAADMIISQKRMGGLQAVRAPFFPPNALLITRLDNLSIYWQEDTRRRSVIDNPKRDRIENFESVNEAYVVEELRVLASGPLAMLRVALYAISGLLGALLSPIGLVVTALAGVALVVWKYWQPITAFLGGVVEGFKAAAGPISAAFEPLKPVFQWIGDKVQALWGWFTDLLTPVKSTSAGLQSAAAMGRRFGEALAEGLNMVMHPLDSLKSGVSWLLEKLGIVSKEAAKAKLPESVTRQQPATVNADGKVMMTSGGFPSWGYGFAGMYDSGGYIPRGQFGIVGENGPEIVNGPANVTSRRNTAALAAVVAGMMGVAAAPAELPPLHPLALPAKGGEAIVSRAATVPPVYRIEAPTQIIIQTQPGQSAQDIAREVARQLDERERRLKAKARSNYRDQGGYDA